MSEVLCNDLRSFIEASKQVGDWTKQDEEEAELALKGDHFITGEKAKAKRVKSS